MCYNFWNFEFLHFSLFRIILNIGKNKKQLRYPLNYHYKSSDNFVEISTQNGGLSVVHTFKKMAVNNFPLKFDIISLLYNVRDLHFTSWKYALYLSTTFSPHRPIFILCKLFHISTRQHLDEDRLHSKGYYYCPGDNHCHHYDFSWSLLVF